MITDKLGASATTVWLTLLFTVALITIILAVDTVKFLTGSTVLAVGAGLVLGLMPSTTVLALLWYNTSLVGLGLTVTVWSAAKALTTPSKRVARTYLTVAMAALVFLFLIRPVFTWPVVLVAICLVTIGALKTRLSGKVVFFSAGFWVLIIIMLTLKNILLFGVWTQSSWSSQNLLRAITATKAVSAEALAQLAETPCEAGLLDPEKTRSGTWFFSASPACAREFFDQSLPNSPVIEWESDPRDFVANTNAAPRLAASHGYNTLLWKTLQNSPIAPLRVALGTANNQGSLQVFLSPITTYFYIQPIIWQSSLYFNLTGQVFNYWAPLALFIMLIGALASVILRRALNTSTKIVLGLGFLLAGYHMFVSVFFEFGENQRFRAEADSLWVILTMTSVTLVAELVRRHPWLFGSMSTRFTPLAIETEPPRLDVSR